MRNLQSILFASLVLVGCGGESEDRADTRVQGSTSYRDATDRQPARPEPQPIEIELRVAGSGTLTGLESPECTIDGASGAFTGLFEGSGSIDESGAFVATSSQAEAVFTTPTASCEIPEVSMEVLTEVVLVAKLSNTQQNCQTYCGAKARSSAEASCEGSADEAGCRAEAESAYEASCTTACTGSTTRRITAEVVIDAQTNAALLADLNARALGVSGLGDLAVDFTFEYVREDGGDGAIVEEAP